MVFDIRDFTDIRMDIRTDIERTVWPWEGKQTEKKAMQFVSSLLGQDQNFFVFQGY